MIEPNKPSPEKDLDTKKLRDLWGKRIDAHKQYIMDAHKKEVSKYYKLLRHEMSGLLPEGVLQSNTGADVNIIYPIVKQLVPHLYFQDPQVFVQPDEEKIIYTARDENGKELHNEDGSVIKQEFSAGRAATKLKSIINRNLRETKFKQTVKSVILDAHLGYYGAVKLGWEHEQGTVSMGGMAPPSFLDETSPNNAYAVRLEPWNVLVDMSNFYNPRWIALRYTVDPTQLKEDTRLENTKDIKGTGLDITERKDHHKAMVSEGELVAEYFEIYVRPSAHYPNGLYLVMSPEVNDKFLYQSEWPFEFKDWSIKLLYFNRDPEGGLPTPDVRYYYAQQKAKSNLRKLEYEFVQRTMPMVVVNTSNIKDVEKLTQQIRAGTVPRVVMTNMNANAVVVPVSFPTLNPQFNQFNKTIDEDTARMSQMFKGVFRGGVGSNVEFAEMAKQSERGEQISLSEKADIVRDFVQECVTVIMKLHQTEGPAKRTVFLEEEGQEVEAELEEIRGKFSAIVQPFSMNYENPTILRRQLQDLLNLLGSPQIQMELKQSGKRANLAKAVEIIIKTFPNKEYESLIQDEAETPEGQIVLALKENHAMGQGQPAKINESDMHAVHILIHGLLGDAALEHIQLHQQALMGGPAKPGGGNKEGAGVKGVAVSQEQLRQPLTPNLTNQKTAIQREAGTR
jgi:hypothetical protein